MQRRLNDYRIWCKEKNEWESDRVFMDGAGVLYQLEKENDQFTRFRRLRSETHVVERYIGLLDKKKIPICVGDIVKNNIAIGVVKAGNPNFLKGSSCSFFYWQMTKQLDYLTFCFEDDVFTEFNDVEIIGNIHVGVVRDDEKSGCSS